jgi:AmmeMemoRadiSam system protein B
MSENVPPLRNGIDIVPSPLEESPGLILRDPFHYTQAVLLVPSIWIPALALLVNGTSTELDLQTTLTRNGGGRLIRREEIQQFVQTLRDHGFLESEEFHRLRDSRHEEFRNALERQPTHAGTAYPADTVELARQLREDFRIVPPSTFLSAGLLGVAAPHVSPFGGVESYSAAYQRLAPGLGDRTFVILGTSHYGAPEKFGLTKKPYCTPLGNAEVDVELMERLAAKAPEAVIREDYCHAVEHSIEFQVIFLQQAVRPNIKILPILCGPLWESLRTGEPPDSNPHVGRFIESLAELARDEGERLFWVLGVDMAHMGARYGDGVAVTANEGHMREVAARDNARLERVCAGDTRGFVDLVKPNQDELKWCGYSPIYTFLRTMEHVRPKLQGRLLRYDQWNIDAQSVVSFGALEFLDGSFPV